MMSSALRCTIGIGDINDVSLDYYLSGGCDGISFLVDQWPLAARNIIEHSLRNYGALFVDSGVDAVCNERYLCVIGRTAG